MKTDKSKKFKRHSLLSVLALVIGVALLVYMVVAEGEPGAIPLLLIVVGTGGYFVTQYRMRSQHT